MFDSERFLGMRLRRFSIASAVSGALLASIMFPASAEAASVWKGPFKSYYSCSFASGQDNPLMRANISIPCQRHDDGKWWYKTRWW